MIAFCGLDCSACEAYKATVADDDNLREKVAKEWSELNHVTITPDMINCAGCRADGPKTVFCASLCQIRQCALKKGFSTCGDCEVMDRCDKVAMIHKTNRQARENLKR